MRLSLFLLLLSVFGLLCQETTSAGQWKVGFLTGSGGLGDESFNDMTYKGLGMAMKKYGSIEVIVREWEPDRAMVPLFRELVFAGADLVILNGEQFAPLVERFASKYPKMLFIANDFRAGRYPNVKSLLYSQHEGAFLAGVLAAGVSKTGRVGFLGGVDIPIVNAFLKGFAEGIGYVSDRVVLKVSYISPQPDYSGFNKPRQGYALAAALYRQGVDVIFAVAGSSGNGVIQAAKTYGKYVIGVDSNQDRMAKGYVLTSVMKRLDTVIFQETVNAFNGRFRPGVAWYGLANGVISLTPMEYTRDRIPPMVLDQLDRLTAKIVQGTITVTNILDP